METHTTIMVIISIIVVWASIIMENIVEIKETSLEIVEMLP